jgi:hypothetical protein
MLALLELSSGTVSSFVFLFVTITTITKITYITRKPAEYIIVIFPT